MKWTLAILSYWLCSTLLITSVPNIAAATQPAIIQAYIDTLEKKGH